MKKLFLFGTVLAITALPGLSMTGFDVGGTKAQASVAVQQTVTPSMVTQNIANAHFLEVNGVTTKDEATANFTANTKAATQFHEVSTTPKNEVTIGSAATTSTYMQAGTIKKTNATQAMISGNVTQRTIDDAATNGTGGNFTATSNTGPAATAAATKGTRVNFGVFLDGALVQANT